MKTRINSKVEKLARSLALKSEPSIDCIHDMNDIYESGSNFEASSKGKKGSLEDDILIPNISQKKRTIQDVGEGKVIESDAFCWICHCEGFGRSCDLCPRFYHVKCLIKVPPPTQWICPECQKIMAAEALETKANVLQLVSINTLSILLKYVLQRMKLPETKPFHYPVDCASIPTYTDFVFHPLDFATIERNIMKQVYGSTEAFIADVRWILHNCIIFNGKNHPLTSVAKSMFKICCHETSELNICPDCYLNSCIKENADWFCEPCRMPHILVWAKMKGYPFWPAKVLREENNQVDVRFFGEHDRAWVPYSQVFLLSENPPGTVPKKTKGFDIARNELDRHLELFKMKFGNFSFAPDKTPYKSSLDQIHKVLGEEIPTSLPSRISSTSVFLSKISNRSALKRKLPYSQTRHYSSKRLFVKSSEVKEIRASGRKHLRRSSDNEGDNCPKLKEDPTKIVLKINKLHLIRKSPPDSESSETSVECSVKVRVLEDIVGARGNEKLVHCNTELPDIQKDGNCGIKNSKDVISSDEINVIDKNNSDSDMQFNKFLPIHNECTDNPSNDEAKFDGWNIFEEDSNSTKNQNSNDKTEEVIRSVELPVEKVNSKSQNSDHFGSQTNHLHEVHLGANEIATGLQSIKEISLDGQSYKPALDVVVVESVQTHEELVSEIKPNSATPSKLPERPSRCYDAVNICDENDDRSKVADEPNSPQIIKLLSKSNSLERTLNNYKELKKFQIENNDIEMKKYVNKMLSNVKNVLSQFIEDMLSSNQSNILHNYVNEELRKIKQSHKAELDALRHTSALQIAEMKFLNQYEKVKFERTKAEEISYFKSKLWCANCLKEAIYNCCWKASYCSFQCQKVHWPKHSDICVQSQKMFNHLSTTKTDLLPMKTEKVRLRLQKSTVRPIQPSIKLIEGIKQSTSTDQHVGISSVVTSLAAIPSYLLQQTLSLQGQQQHLCHHQQFVIQRSPTNILAPSCNFMSPLSHVVVPVQKLP